MKVNSSKKATVMRLETVWWDFRLLLGWGFRYSASSFHTASTENLELGVYAYLSAIGRNMAKKQAKAKTWSAPLFRIGLASCREQ